MTYEMHVLTVNEQTVIHPVEDILLVDQLVPLFGQRFTEVKSINIVAKMPLGDVVVHTQSFV